MIEKLLNEFFDSLGDVFSASYYYRNGMKEPILFINGRRQDIGDDKKRVVNYDIIDDKDVLRVLFELPGVDKGAIDLRCGVQDVDLLVADFNAVHIKLPMRVSLDDIKSSYLNGVLELILKKRDDKVNVKID